MTSIPLWLAHTVTSLAVAAGAAGLVLTLADVNSPLRVPLLLLFLAVAPAVAVAGLLRGFDTLAVLVIGGTATIAINSLVAATMLALGVWSPRAGLLAVASITAVCLAGQLPAARARATRRSSPQPTAPERDAAHRAAEAGMASRVEEAATTQIGAVPALRPTTPATAAARTATARPRQPPAPTDTATAQFPAFRPQEPVAPANQPTAQTPTILPQEPEEPTDAPTAQIPAVRWTE